MHVSYVKGADSTSPAKLRCISLLASRPVLHSTASPHCLRPCWLSAPIRHRTAHHTGKSLPPYQILGRDLRGSHKYLKVCNPVHNKQDFALSCPHRIPRFTESELFLSAKHSSSEAMEVSTSFAVSLLIRRSAQRELVLTAMNTQLSFCTFPGAGSTSCLCRLLRQDHKQAPSHLPAAPEIF